MRSTLDGASDAWVQPDNHQLPRAPSLVEPPPPLPCSPSLEQLQISDISDQQPLLPCQTPKLSQGTLGPEEKRFRHELAELRQLVVEQQFKAHRFVGQMTSQLENLRKEQERQLQEAIKRIEVTAPWRNCDLQAGSIRGESPERVNGVSGLMVNARRATPQPEFCEVGHSSAKPEDDRAKSRDVLAASRTKEDLSPGSPKAIGDRRTSERSIKGSSKAVPRASTTRTDIVREGSSKVREVSVPALKLLATDMWRHIVEFMELASLSSSPSHDKTCFEQINSSIYFKISVSLAILLNGICIGCQEDDLLKSIYRGESKSSQEQAWQTLEICFTAFFAAELAVRACAERSSFIFGHNWAMNFFDFILVSSSIVNLIFTAIPDISFARILRLFRVTRTLRILRAMRTSESLRVMVFSILSSITSLLWVLLLLFFVMYFFSVLFTNFIADHFQSKGLDDIDLVEKAQSHYSSVLDTIYSLFMCISGGVDWGEVAEPLRMISPWFFVIFVGYIFFMTFGVLNVVVGQFVDNAQRASQKDRDSVVKNELRQEKEYSTNMQTIFKEADRDGDGQLSWEEFEEYLSNGKAAAYFSTLGLDVSIARTLFELLDVDDTDQVGIEEFVGGCMRLRGAARSIDVNMLLYETEKMCYKLTEFMQDTTVGLSNLDSLLRHGPLDSESGPGTDGANSQRSARPSRPSISSDLRAATAELRDYRRRPPRPIAQSRGTSSADLPGDRAR